MKCPHCGKEIPDDYGEEEDEEKLDHIHIPGRVCLKCHPKAGLIALKPAVIFSS